MNRSIIESKPVWFPLFSLSVGGFWVDHSRYLTNECESIKTFQNEVSFSHHSLNILLVITDTKETRWGTNKNNTKRTKKLRKKTMNNDENENEERKKNEETNDVWNEKKKKWVWEKKKKKIKKSHLLLKTSSNGSFLSFVPKQNHPNEVLRRCIFQQSILTKAKIEVSPMANSTNQS